MKRRELLTAVLGSPLLIAASKIEQSTTLPPLLEHELIVAGCYSGPITDGGWSMIHYKGLMAAKKAYPAMKLITVESVPYSTNATRIFRHLVAEGAQMVFAASMFGDFLKNVSLRSPEVAFIECDGQTVLPNLGWFYIKHWDVGYILGQAAGLMSKTKKLGFVGSFPVPSVIGHANSVLLGARSVAPDITVQVININAWFDPQAATQAATALCDSGCDILFGMMNEASYLRVAEQRGLMAVMWNTDMRSFGPKAYISSTSCDFSGFYINQIGQRLQGVWSSHPVFLSLAQGVDRDAWGENVPSSVARQADATRERILKGYNPFIGPLYDINGKMRIPKDHQMTAMELYKWDWPLKGVMGIDLN
ncbi:BMP family ABC transporter substrate-binding protein [Entomobacter blattae]|uniref:Purine-binding protein n=1 Tax=Entomobacter blattae TaxID=2762277 RepID=A0A7H1NU84_9PROT|nr:BMP family ABC transporter substrate-binding protein [Entomobacter blattae]QNT79344.1 Purine-binding protein [Entomobacter blattae]